MNRIKSIIESTNSVGDSWRDLDLHSHVNGFDQLLSEYLNYVSQESSEILEQNDGVIITSVSSKVSKKSKINKVVDLFSKVAFTRGTDKMFQIGEDESTRVWLPPYRIQDMKDSEAKTRIIKRASNETMIGGIMNIPQTIFCVAASMGVYEMEHNVFLGRMKTYLEDVLKGEEPFFEVVRSKIQSNTIDSVAPIRMLLLLQHAWMEYIFRDVLPMGLAEEVCDWLFCDPTQNTADFKKHTTLLTKSFFDLSEEGKAVIWDAQNIRTPEIILTGFQEADLPGNDKPHYAYVYKGLQDELEWLKGNGLFKMAQTLTDLIKAEVNADNFRLITWILAIPSMTGYSRSETAQSHISQMQREDKPGPDFKANYASLLEYEWEKMVEWGHENGRFLTYEEYRRQVPGLLTTRSAGGAKVEVEVYVGDEDSSGIRGISDDSTIRLLFTSKTPVFNADPERILDPETVKVGYTAENPGAIGQRQVVGGKMTRPITMRRLEHYLPEAMIALPLMDYQQAMRDKTGAPLGTGNDFVVGNEKGTVLADHAGGFYASSNKNILLKAGDFSGFDTTQHEVNARGPARRGLLKGLLRHGYDRPHGPWKGGIVEVLETIWGRGHTLGAIFETKGVDGPVQIEMDQLQSGELMTLNFNNMTNRANSRDFLSQFEKMDDLKRVMKLMKTRFQGDDTEEWWHVPEFKSFSRDDYAAFVELSESTAEGNGLVMNPQKTTSRFFYYEFLKKQAMYGQYVPLAIIQLFSTERGQKPVFPTEQIRSYANTLGSVVFRTGVEKPLLRLLSYSWNFRRGLRIPVSKGVTKWYYLPFALLWTPGSMKGIGQLPWTLIGASKDQVIAIEASKNPVFENLINRAATIMLVPNVNIRREIANSILDGSALHVTKVDGKIVKTPRKVFELGIEYTRSTLLESRVQSAFKSRDFLEKEGSELPGRMFYPDFPEARIRDAVEQDPNTQAVAALERLKLGKAYLRNQEKMKEVGPIVSIKDQFLWIYTLNWESTTRVEYKIPTDVTPFPVFTGFLHTLTRQLGVAAGASAYEVNPGTIINELRKDKFYRRDIQPEALLAYLTSPSIIRSPEHIFNALISTGARDDIATKIAADLTNRSRSFAFKQAARGFSMNDQILPNLDLGLESHNDIISPPALPDVSVNQLISELGMLWSISEGSKDGYIKRVNVSATNESIPIILRDVLKMKNWEILTFQKFFDV